MSLWTWVAAAATVIVSAAFGLIIGTLGLLTSLTIF